MCHRSDNEKQAHIKIDVIFSFLLGRIIFVTVIIGCRKLLQVSFLYNCFLAANSITQQLSLLLTFLITIKPRITYYRQLTPRQNAF